MWTHKVIDYVSDVINSMALVLLIVIAMFIVFGV